LGDFSLGVDRDELALIYKDATKNKFDFLKVDIDQPDNNKKFSKNFTGFYHIDSDDEVDNEIGEILQNTIKTKK